MTAQDPIPPKIAIDGPTEDSDRRALWQWKTRYHGAWPQITREAVLLALYLSIFSILTTIRYALQGDIKFSLQIIPASEFVLSRNASLVYLVGSVGSSIFAIKWLMHSVANGLWHQDRVIWRVFVPLTGGIYALVVVTLLQAGLMGSTLTQNENEVKYCAIAFLAGYFADGVSGLLSNVANAIFGKVELK